MTFKSGELLQHYKGGRYVVLHTATHTETGELFVVYSKLMDEGNVWVRPVKLFNETVEHNGKKVQRFMVVGNAY